MVGDDLRRALPGVVRAPGAGPGGGGGKDRRPPFPSVGRLGRGSRVRARAPCDPSFPPGVPRYRRGPLRPDAGAREGASMGWGREDMRKFARRGAFDACLSLFTSFGFFNDEENELVIGNVAKSLKEGGTLLLDLRNAQKGLAGEEDTETTVAVPSGRLRLRVRFDRATRRARAEHELTRPDGIRISPAFAVRIYSEEGRTGMLCRPGMPVAVVHGSLDGAPFTPGAERMVVIAKRL